MHDYSMDRHPKEKILFVLAFLAIMVTPWLNSLLKGVSSHLENYTGPISGISVFLIFTLIFFIFDRYLWKFQYIRKFLLMPDLNGKWECKGTTLRKDGADTNYRWDGEIEITQSWSRILIHLSSKNSDSVSTTASIRRIDGHGYKILYLYENNPMAIQQGLTKHDGAAEITFNFDCDSGLGNYFTDEHRGTVGTLEFRRKK